MPGLLYNGRHVDVPGLNIISPGDEPWAKLDKGDFRSRPTKWIRQIMCHTTKGVWPQKILPGVGPAHRAKLVADFWRGDPQHSAAPLVVGSDGIIACLADLFLIEAWHAGYSNPWSIGIEGYQEAGGGLYEAMLDSYVKLIVALCKLTGVQFQIPKRAYNGHPMKRMLMGGPDMIGVFGHRDNTEDRGRGDPGEELFLRLVAAGAEQFDFEAGEDIAVWKTRQTDLIKQGYKLTSDGLPGPATVAALKASGVPDGIWAFR